MVDHVREVAAGKYCKCGEYGLSECVLFCLQVSVIAFTFAYACQVINTTELLEYESFWCLRLISKIVYMFINTCLYLDAKGPCQFLLLPLVFWFWIRLAAQTSWQLPSSCTLTVNGLVRFGCLEQYELNSVDEHVLRVWDPMWHGHSSSWAILSQFN